MYLTRYHVVRFLVFKKGLELEGVGEVRCCVVLLTHKLIFELRDST